MDARAGEEDESEEDLKEQGVKEDALTAESAQQKDIDLVSPDEAHDQRREGESESLGAHVEAVHEDDGRTCDEGEEARKENAPASA